MPELFFIDPAPSANIADQQNGVVSSQQSSVQATPVATTGQSQDSRIESLEKYVNNLRENAVMKDSDASLNSLTIKNNLTSFFGKIAGWLMNAGVLSTEKMIIDSNNSEIKSYNYKTGVSGFKISPDLIEAENGIFRGIMRGSVFAYDKISAIGGQLMVSNADTLAEDVSSLDNVLFKTKGDSTFSVNDVWVIRGIASSGIQEEWLRVTAVSGNYYTVTRDLAGSFSANSNPSWKAGTPIVKQGKSDGVSTYSGGWLRLFGEGTNSPYYSVFARTGVAYNAYTEVARLGNLNGIGSFAADTWGIYIGDSTSNLSYDNTSGELVVAATKLVKPFTVGMAVGSLKAIYVNTDEKMYMADANYTNVSAFVGFTTSSGTKDSKTPIQTFGVVKGLSGLVAGSSYYIKNATQTVRQSQLVDDGSHENYGVQTLTQSFTTGAESDQNVTKITFKNCFSVNPGKTVAMKLKKTADNSLIYDFGSPNINIATDQVFPFSVPLQLDVSTSYYLEVVSSDATTWNWYDNGGAREYSITYAENMGLIDTSPGSYSKKVGLATSSTELLILNS